MKDVTNDDRNAPPLETTAVYLQKQAQRLIKTTDRLVDQYEKGIKDLSASGALHAMEKVLGVLVQIDERLAKIEGRDSASGPRNIIFNSIEVSSLDFGSTSGGNPPDDGQVDRPTEGV